MKKVDYFGEHYYPFGLNHEGPFYSTQPTQNQYQYNDKELNEEFGLNWLDYGHRFYDPAIGRFPSVDAYAEKYYSMTPYQYGANNPIKYIDVMGDSIAPPQDNNLSAGNILQGFAYAFGQQLPNALGLSSVDEWGPSKSGDEGGDGVAFSAEIGQGEETRVNEGAEEVGLNELFDNFSVPGQASSVNKVLGTMGQMADVGTGLDVLTTVANTTNKMVDVSGGATLPGAKQLENFIDPNNPAKVGKTDTVQVDGKSYRRTQVSKSHTKHELLEN